MQIRSNSSNKPEPSRTIILHGRLFSVKLNERKLGIQYVCTNSLMILIIANTVNATLHKIKVCLQLTITRMN